MKSRTSTFAARTPSEEGVSPWVERGVLPSGCDGTAMVAALSLAGGHQCDET